VLVQVEGVNAAKTMGPAATRLARARAGVRAVVKLSLAHLTLQNQNSSTNLLRGRDMDIECNCY
jgi:hypothetical protein